MDPKRIKVRPYECTAINKKDRYKLVKYVYAFSIKDAEKTSHRFFNEKHFNKPKCKLSLK